MLLCILGEEDVEGDAPLTRVRGVGGLAAGHVEVEYNQLLKLVSKAHVDRATCLLEQDHAILTVVQVSLLVCCYLADRHLDSYSETIP